MTLYQFLNSGSHQTVVMSNTMYLGTPAQGELTVPELTAAVTPIRAWYTSMSTFNGAETFWVPAARVLKIDPANPSAPPEVMPVTPGAAVQGTGGVATASQLAICVNWRTVLAGRSYRGRTFAGALSSAQVAGGSLTPTAVTGINAACATLISS